MKYIRNTLLLLALTISTYAHAGGIYFPINITDIQSVSKKEHHVYFSLVKNAWFDNFDYPLENCETVKLTIEYKEWRIFDNIMLSIKNIFTFNHGVKELNKNIDKLIQNQDNITILSDVEAFQYHPNNLCHIISKTLDIKNIEQIVINENLTLKNALFLQPQRQISQISNHPKE